MARKTWLRMLSEHPSSHLIVARPAGTNAAEMADLVGENAHQHLGVATSEFDEFVGHDDRTVRQGEGIGPNEPPGAKVERVSPLAARRSGAPPQGGGYRSDVGL